MIAVSYIKSSLVTDLVNHFTEKKQRRGKVRSPPVTSVPFFLSFSLFFCLDTAKSPSIGLHTLYSPQPCGRVPPCSLTVLKVVLADLQNLVCLRSERRYPGAV